MGVDDSELRALSVSLGAAGQQIKPEAKKVLSKGAVNIKKQLVSEANRSRHFRFGRTISYDFVPAGDGLSVEIGPTPGGAGSLAGFAYFGGAHGGGGTVPDPQGALEAEAPNVERYLADLIDKALG